MNCDATNAKGSSGVDPGQSSLVRIGTCFVTHRGFTDHTSEEVRYMKAGVPLEFEIHHMMDMGV